MTKAEEWPQNITTKEIQGLLPNLNDTSASSVLDTIEAWKIKLGNVGIHRDLWGSITLSKLKRKTLLNLQQSVKRDCNLDEICGALENKCDDDEDNDEMIISLPVRNDREEATNCTDNGKDDVGSILRITGQNEKINAKADLAM